MHELNPRGKGKTGFDWALTKTTPMLGVEHAKAVGR